MAKKKTGARKGWVWAPAKPSKPAISEAEKKRAETLGQELLERMKPQWIQPPSEEWGYVSDVYGKWYRSYYYFCALYRYPTPKFIRPEAEQRFARLEYAGPDQFHLAYFRHTGQWWQVYENLSLEACLREIETNSIFLP